MKGDYPITNDSWHSIAFTFNAFEGLASFYVDDKLGYEVEASDGTFVAHKGLSFPVSQVDWIKSKIFTSILESREYFS